MQSALIIAISLASVAAFLRGPVADVWDDLRQRIIDSRSRGDLAGAVLAGERLLNLTDTDFAGDRERVLEALSLLSVQYRAAEAYGKEELVRQRELRLWFVLKAPSPTADRSLATEIEQDLNDVASHYAPMPLTHPTPLALLSNLADQHCVSGRYRRAEALYLKILELRAPSSNVDAASASVHRLGELYLHLGKTEDAEPRFRKAIELRRKVYGRSHFFVASSLLGLADATAANGRTDLAVDALQDALRIVQIEYGDTHPQTAYHLVRLATILETAGRRVEAAAARARADTIHKRFRGAG
jgi:tetratricopeptide (TPR) repeat protein